MESLLFVQLKGSEAQLAQLVALQSLFARACNNLAPLVSQTRCWNRVALHHLAYKGLRERYPQLGSQMVCNVIYSVCRAARLVYQHPQSPWNAARADQSSLPVIVFSDDTPVFFDRHTLSIKKGQVSLFTLDGRMRFELGLAPEDELRFRQEKLREISLEKRAGSYYLRFVLSVSEQSESAKSSLLEIDAAQARQMDLPSYLVVHNQPAQTDLSQDANEGKKSTDLTQPSFAIQRLRA
jgi:hypothetical protein